MGKRGSDGYLLWDSKAHGQAVKAELDGQQVYIDKQHCRIPLVSESPVPRFKGREPKCMGFRRHRWNPEHSKCGRCGRTDSVEGYEVQR